MGTLCAKCIQDCRLIDIPLSLPLLKLLCMGDVVDNVSQSYREMLYRNQASDECLLLDDDVTPTEDTDKDLTTSESGVPPPYMHSSSCSSVVSIASSGPAWFSGLLSQDDFELVDPHRARFLQQLRVLANTKAAILADGSLSEKERKERLEGLTLENPPVPLEDLG